MLLIIETILVFLRFHRKQLDLNEVCNEKRTSTHIEIQTRIFLCLETAFAYVEVWSVGLLCSLETRYSSVGCCVQGFNFWFLNHVVSFSISHQVAAFDTSDVNKQFLRSKKHLHVNTPSCEHTFMWTHLHVNIFLRAARLYAKELHSDNECVSDSEKLRRKHNLCGHNTSNLFWVFPSNFAVSITQETGIETQNRLVRHSESVRKKTN